MKYRQMGSLPWKVSALGFGCMRLPVNKILRTVDEKYAIDIIRKGIDLGINYVDTAWMYHMGRSEAVLGKALQNGYREKVKLVTKLPMIFVRKEEDFEKFLNLQLERLQTDHIDIYLFHMLNQSNFDKVKNFNFIEKMENAKRQGRIGHIGFSFHDTLPVFKNIIDFYNWEMAQIQYNYMDTSIQATTEGLKYAHSKGIAVVIMEPLKGGQLANPPKEALDVINSAPVKRSPVDWALQFLWNKPEVSCVLSGMSNMKMVEENCRYADNSGVGTLSEKENETIEKIADIYRKKIIVPCTACKYCLPCPAGVDIPQNFALLNNKSIGGARALMNRFIQMQIMSSYRKLPGKKEDISPKRKGGKASMCINCKACIPKCPQQINIPEELQKVVSVFEKKKPVSSFQNN